MSLDVRKAERIAKDMMNSCGEIGERHVARAAEVICAMAAMFVYTCQRYNIDPKEAIDQILSVRASE